MARSWLALAAVAMGPSRWGLSATAIVDLLATMITYPGETRDGCYYDLLLVWLGLAAIATSLSHL